MITKENLSEVLKCLGFEKRGDIYSKHYEKVNCDIRIDFKNEKIEYPSNLDTGANTTTNFSQAENFVVLECVNRLLEKGYLPETIFLEKSWTLGHTGKSGRADITVYDNKGNAYLIIECKRAGSDYKDARKELFEDPAGKQLFSYWAQARSTQWLQLYASDYDEENDDVAYKEEIVRSFDDKNVELLAKEDDSILLYKNASTADDFFIVWTETYSKKVYHNIIFGDDSIAYNIGNQPIKNKDLRKFKKEDGITDSFREILRHNSISDKENAFNKLLSLFICKFVDEELHREENDIMHFQYIDGKDNYYSLYERLLALFQIGMREFLKEEVFYLDNDYIRKTLDQFTGKKRKELENELVEKFQKTKMLSCQVFAFREVYNEKLFLQNGKVLVEVVELFQNYKISYTSKDQFLGELFENLLDQGFKQEAGQFFTPIPITRFVWNSLPLERYLSFETPKMPKVIDFACGSGHFLTEGVSAISDSLLNFEDKIISKSFYGIDKDNRLARVSKVAMLLNGASNAKIKSGDGLEHDENFLGELNSFDILVANPPYSVDAFKTHESRKVQNAYETIKLMTFSCGDIQNVFIERMHNLLKPQGIAAIVMPSSLLSNTEAADLKTREILLHNFQIRCIANFGGKTFGKTSTNTIILFLEHFDFPPYKSKLLKDSATAIVSGEKLEDWNDSVLFDEYLKTIETEKDAYIKFVSETESLFENTFVPYFKEYETAFRNQASTKKALDKILETERKEKASKTLKKNEKSSAEQKQLLSNEFFEWVKKIEENKLLIFALTYKQKTLIITAPTDTNEQKRFLGYTSSERRGSEGLIETDGLLTNISDRNDKQKLAWSVRCAFDDKQCINGELEKYAKYVQTSDMLDFNKPSFDMQIKLTADKKIVIESKYKLVNLGGIAEVLKGKSITSSQTKKGNVKVVAGGIDYAYTHNESNRPANTITISASGANAGYVNFWREPIFASDCTTVRGKNDLHTIFLYNFLLSIQDQIYYLQKGAAQPHVYPDDLKLIQVPDVDEKLQRKIVSECEKVDEEYNNSKMSIEENEIKIAETYKLLDSKADVSKRLSDKNIFDVSIGRRVLNSEVNSDFKFPVYSANVFEPFGMIDRLLIEDFSKDSVLWGIDGDWMVNVIPANKQFYPTDHCGVLRVKTNDILPKYMAHLLEEEGKKVGFKRSYRASIDRIESLSVKVAPIEEQRKAISEIETYEQKIAEAKSVMSGCADRKKQILDKWLK
ncbi:MAG: N-6 DNA methylase [Bacteroidales bacterium]|nr:N-6 DNA methylase [Bacteroidales bacterium]